MVQCVCQVWSPVSKQVCCSNEGTFFWQRHATRDQRSEFTPNLFLHWERPLTCTTQTTTTINATNNTTYKLTQLITRYATPRIRRGRIPEEASDASTCASEDG